MSSIPTAVWVILAVVFVAPVLSFAFTSFRVLRAESRGIGTPLTEVGFEEFIVVFGAEVDETGPSPELSGRLDHAQLLWANGSGLVILVSGGVARGIDETLAMRRYLVDKGVPQHAIGEVRPGDTTRATIGALKAFGVERALAVSSSYHCHRIRSEAKRRELHLIPNCPADTPETLRGATHRARRITEVIASWWYALPESLTSRVNTKPGSLRHRFPEILSGEARVAKKGSDSKRIPVVENPVGAPEQ